MRNFFNIKALRSALSTENLSQNPRSYWLNLFCLTFMAAFAYVFFEWLFIVTKPSFMSALGFPTKLGILLFSGTLLFALSSLLLMPLFLISKLPFLKKYSFQVAAIGAILPALLLGSLTLLLIDNFTYTIFSFGIVSSQGVTRAIYASLFVLASILWWFYLTRKIVEISWKHLSPLLRKAVLYGLVLVCLLPVPFVAYRLLSQRQQGNIALIPSGSLPNILLITADGLNANNLSLYGYERQTTPYLEKLASSSLVAENAFANAAYTTGSLVSIYTGKSPLRTKVLYPPDILRGADAYQHLPGILKSLGYYNAQFTVPHYADAAKQNLLESFDLINGREATEIGSVSTFNQYMPINDANFSNELYQRLVGRLGYIFHLADMENPYKMVTRPAKRIDDQIKIHKALTLLKTSDQPVFIHIHLMSTHGPEWYPAEQFFSSGLDAKHQKPWNVDFYDDSIRDFDQTIEKIIKELKRKNLLDKTVIILGSDHGEKWDNLQKVPLLIRFPNNAHSGTITGNVQLLDIAPTILDYLGLRKPEWMEGDSLLKIGSTQRPIITASTSTSLMEMIEETNLRTDQKKVGPPFYQFASISIIDCQKWDRLSLIDHTLEEGEIIGYTTPCKDGDHLPQEQVYQLILDYLKVNNFDVSSLVNIKTVSTKP